MQFRPDGTGQNRTEPDGTGWNRTEPDGTGQNRMEPDRTGWNRTEPDAIKMAAGMGALESHTQPPGVVIMLLH